MPQASIHNAEYDDPVYMHSISKSVPDTNNSETVLIAENVSTDALTLGYPLQHKLAVQSHSSSTDPSGCYSGTGEESKYGDSLLLTSKSSRTKTFIRQFITILFPLPSHEVSQTFPVNV